MLEIEIRRMLKWNDFQFRFLHRTIDKLITVAKLLSCAKISFKLRVAMQQLVCFSVHATAHVIGNFHKFLDVRITMAYYFPNYEYDENYYAHAVDK